MTASKEKTFFCLRCRAAVPAQETHFDDDDGERYHSFEVGADIKGCGGLCVVGDGSPSQHHASMESLLLSQGTEAAASLHQDQPPSLLAKRLQWLERLQHTVLLWYSDRRSDFMNQWLDVRLKELFLVEPQTGYPNCPHCSVSLLPSPQHGDGRLLCPLCGHHFLPSPLNNTLQEITHD